VSTIFLVLSPCNPAEVHRCIWMQAYSVNRQCRGVIQASNQQKSGSAVNRTRNLWICSQELWPLDHRGGRSNRQEAGKLKQFYMLINQKGFSPRALYETCWFLSHNINCQRTEVCGTIPKMEAPAQTMRKIRVTWNLPHSEITPVHLYSEDMSCCSSVCSSLSCIYTYGK
jgi:hypothetical protein